MTTDLDEIRARHEQVEGVYKPYVCDLCRGDWPCDAIQLCDEVERLEKELLDFAHEYAGRESYTEITGENDRLLEELRLEREAIDGCHAFINDLNTEVERLREGLGFYAIHENWSYFPSQGEDFARSEVGKDWGLIARAALEPKG